MVLGLWGGPHSIIAVYTDPLGKGILHGFGGLIQNDNSSVCIYIYIFIYMYIHNICMNEPSRQKYPSVWGPASEPARSPPRHTSGSKRGSNNRRPSGLGPRVSRVPFKGAYKDYEKGSIRVLEYRGLSN